MDLLGDDISLDDVKSVPSTPEYSLSAILAEYGDEPAPSAGSVEARSREIVMEALGETISAGLRDTDADGTEGLPPEPAREPARRESGRRRKKSRRPARPQREARGAHEHPDPIADTYEPSPGVPAAPAEPESPAPIPPEPPAEPDDGDVKVYRPARGGLPEGDEDVKIYSAHESVRDTIAEAERRSARWSSRAATLAPERPAEPESPSAGVPSPSWEPEYPGEEQFPDGDAFSESSYEDTSAEGGEYASAGDYRHRYEPPARPANPLLALLALVSMRLQGLKRETPPAPESEEDEGEEMPAEEAVKYYAGHAVSLKLRARLAFAVCVVLAWLSLGLPAAGALGSDLRSASLVCLIMELTVVVLGLDVFTAGIMSLARGRPGLWSLVSLSCVAAAADALLTYLLGEAGWGLPFCAAAALSMAFALWGASLTSRGLRLSVKALVLASEPSLLVSVPGLREGETAISRIRRGTAGYLRRCEEPDGAEWAYSSLAPFLIAASLLLSLISAAVTGLWPRFFRIFAALTCACAPCAAFIACPLPFSMLARRVFRAGASVAGWAGMRDIGKSGHIVVTDTDLFPRTTVSIESIRILQGTFPETIIAAAGSLICASGSGLSGVFLDLMRRNGCTMQRVEDFSCSDGGGLRALINGSEVLCGSAGYMHLSGVRLPQKLASKSSVFVSVNGVLMGIFTIKYTPMTSVQEALSTLLRARREPVFAIRDFLVTPLMIRQRFRLPTDGFEFPPFEDRYRVSGEDGADSPPAALLSREGLASYAEVSESARRAYAASSFSTALSVVCAVVGLLLGFVLTLTTGLPPTSGQLLTYLLLWLVPPALVSLVSLGLGD